MSKPKPFSWMHPALEVRNTSLCGQGVFAKSTIVAGQKICVLGGYVLQMAEIKDDEALQIDEHLFMSTGGGV